MPERYKPRMGNPELQSTRTEKSHDEHVDFDGIARAWFNDELPLVQEPTHTPVTEYTDLPQSTLDRLLTSVRTNPRMTALLTGASIAITACSVDFDNLTSTDDNAVHPIAETRTVAEPSRALDIHYGVQEIDITINDGVTIHVRDGLDPEAANEPLPDIAFDNPVFAWHADIVATQYRTSFGAPEPIHAFRDPMKWQEARVLVTEDEFTDYATAYGNMELGNMDFVENYVHAMWLEAARTLYDGSFHTIEDLESLTIQQWMAVLQAPGLSLQYDDSLASIYPTYDPKKTEVHRNKTIEELIRGGNGVCRDTERLNITSFMLANETFRLVERGLLYVPQINIADAKHTRGAFMWSQTPNDIVMVGVDTTFANGDIDNTFNVTQADAAAWYAQQFDDSIIAAPEEHIATYELAIEALPELSPTAVAMLERSIIFEKIRLYEAAQTHSEKRLALKDAFETMLSQITKEETVGVFPLNIPSRKVRMYDMFLRVATELDALSAAGGPGVYTAVAKKHLEEYLHREGVNPQKARMQVEEIDRLNSDERNEYIERLTQVLDN